MLKMPDMVLPTMQACRDVGLNAFALKLLAESYSDDGKLHSDKAILVRMEDHQHRDVWIYISRQEPKPADFAPVEVVGV